MKALILAAGLGTRLAPITNDRPKSLVPVNGTPIIIKQIKNLYENNVADITVVSGYKAEVLEARIHHDYPEVRIIESIDYASTNNMYSAFLGIKAMFPEGINEPFLMMNADVFYDESVVKALTNDRRANLIVVDIGRYMEESMKVVEGGGHIVAISKQISREDALGCSIDVYKFGMDGGRAFFKHCKDYIEDRKELKLWSEVALNDALTDVAFEACPLVGRWFEIDNHDDLAEAEKLFSK